MSFTFVDRFLWMAGFIGHAVLLFVLLRLGRWRTFPIFTALVGYQAFNSLMLFTVSRIGTAHAYFQCYWVSALGDYAFQIALLREIARDVFSDLRSWRYTWRRGTVVLIAAGLLLAGAVCMTMAPPGVKGLDLWDERTTLFTSLLTCELFLVISLMANRLRLQWRDHVMAIGEGLALWAGVAVLGDVLHALLGWKADTNFFDRLRMAVYLGDLAYWSVMLSRPERKQFWSFGEVDQMAQRFQRDRDQSFPRHLKGPS